MENPQDHMRRLAQEQKERFETNQRRLQEQQAEGRRRQERDAEKRRQEQKEHADADRRRNQERQAEELRLRERAEDKRRQDQSERQRREDAAKLRQEVDRHNRAMENSQRRATGDAVSGPSNLTSTSDSEFVSPEVRHVFHDPVDSDAPQKGKPWLTGSKLIKLALLVVSLYFLLSLILGNRVVEDPIGINEAIGDSITSAPITVNESSVILDTDRVERTTQLPYYPPCSKTITDQCVQDR